MLFIWTAFKTLSFSSKRKPFDREGFQICAVYARCSKNKIKTDHVTSPGWKKKITWLGLEIANFDLLEKYD
jgi:hypothetical protein